MKQSLPDSYSIIINMKNDFKALSAVCHVTKTNC